MAGFRRETDADEEVGENEEEEENESQDSGGPWESQAREELLEHERKNDAAD